MFLFVSNFLFKLFSFISNTNEKNKLFENEVIKTSSQTEHNLGVRTGSVNSSSLLGACRVCSCTRTHDLAKEKEFLKRVQRGHDGLSLSSVMLRWYGGQRPLGDDIPSSLYVSIG